MTNMRSPVLKIFHGVVATYRPVVALVLELVRGGFWFWQGLVGCRSGSGAGGFIRRSRSEEVVEVYQREVS
jgi:hypothetical protein